MFVKTALAAAINTAYGDVPTLTGLEGVFENIVTVVIGVAGIALFIMFLIGGFKFITSGGDPKAAEEAKKTLTYAIGGIVLIAISFLVLQLIQQFTGASVTIFKVFTN